VSELELEELNRAHGLFVGASAGAGTDLGAVQTAPEPSMDTGPEHYQRAAGRSRAVLVSTARTDSTVAAVIAAAHQDHATARELTGAVVDEARADAAVTPATALAQREAMRRRVARLRAQRAHVLSARVRARRHRAVLRGLQYRTPHHRGRLPAVNGRAGAAVRAALSRLGRPYVWGATGPDRFDCSGLVQWAYAQAGVHLDRTTYQQIHDGIPVPRSQVRPGDLVFPHAGHVQMAIGNNMVVEAPYSGASVRISPLGGNVAIRRPL
jgi:cell wall-associated NlpC family hydrolase